MECPLLIYQWIIVSLFYIFSNRQVDSEILTILRQRKEDCIMYEREDHRTKCAPILEEYEKAAENWFIKCKN